MKQYKTGRYVFLSIIGFVIFGTGLALTKLLPETNEILKTFPFLCVGIGAGIFGGNLGAAIAGKKLRSNPQAAKQMEIEQKDERSQAVSSRAKAKAYDLMIYAYAAILFAFTFVQADMYVILTLTAVYLIVVFSNIYYHSKYNKEM